jgi:hypothetical protein
MDMWSGRGWGLSPQYIPRLHATKEYILIFLGNEKYNDIYSSALYSSVISLVNRGIYTIFVGCKR